MRSTLLSKPKATHGRLIHRLEVNPQTCLLTFAAHNAHKEGSPEEVSFGDRGGQYIIVDTGLLTAEGRPLKRAYSLVPTVLPLAARDRLNAGETPFTLGIYRMAAHEAGTMATAKIPASEGLFASERLCNAALDTVFSFSGPWGRMAPESVLKGEPLDTVPSSPALVISAGTGITGGLGLFCSKVLRSVHQPLRLLWLDTGGFLSHEVVLEIIQSQRLDSQRPGHEVSGFTRIVTGENPQTEGSSPGDWSAWIHGCLQAPDHCGPGQQGWTLYYLGDGRFYPGLETWISQLNPPLGVSFKKEFYYHRPQEGITG